MENNLEIQLEKRTDFFAVLETGLMALVNFVALFGNLLVCSCVIRNRRLRTIPNTFVVALAISDICMVSIPMPLTVGVLAAGYDIFGAFPCSLQGFSILTFGLNSLQTMALIAVNRYVFQNPSMVSSFIMIRNFFYQVRDTKISSRKVQIFTHKFVFTKRSFES